MTLRGGGKPARGEVQVASAVWECEWEWKYLQGADNGEANTESENK